MRAIIAIFVSVLLVQQVQANCLETLHRLRVRHQVTRPVLSETEDLFMQRLDRIEQTGTWLRRLRKDKRPAIHAQMSKRMAKLDGHIFVGDYATVHRELRTLFRQVEFSALAIHAINRSLESVRTSSVRSIEEARAVLGAQNIPARQWLDRALGRATTLDGVVDELVFERARYEVKLGSKFQEYLLAREHLESMLKADACSADCQSNIQRLLESLGHKYRSDQVRFQSFFEIQADISSDGIRYLIDSHRVAATARVRKERNAEFVAVLSEFATQPAIVQKILFGLTGIPGMHKLRVVRLFKGFLDSFANAKHVPIINNIVREQSATATKLDKVLQQNGTFGGNEFLISFARRSDLQTKRVWSELISAASTRDEALGTQLLKADELARARGPLELLNSSSVLPRWLVMAATGAGAGYFWFGKSEIIEIDEDDESDDVVPSIPLEGEEDEEIEAVIEELQNPAVEMIIMPRHDRAPGSTQELGFWQRLKNTFKLLF